MIDDNDAASKRRQTLEDYVGGRDNNFNLIRFLAAFAVLLSHSYALSTGDSSREPLRGWLGMSAGDVAVDVFFMTSGFLVTGSLIARQSVLSFATARALRIYPGLLLSIVVTIIAVGLWFSSQSLASFFLDRETWRYLAKNGTLVTGIAYNLPGVFEFTPFRLAVNGSLWSLPYELGMYALLAMAWLAVAIVRLPLSKYFAGAVALILVLALGAEVGLLHVSRIEPLTWHLVAMFFAGSCLYLFRIRVPVDRRLFALLLLALIGASISTNKRAFAITYLFTMPYVVLYLSYVPGGLLRRFNRLGDYSYGTYIYAFPVQQMLAASVPGIGPLQMLGASFAITTILAVLSWHWIEKNALALKTRAGAATAPSPPRVGRNVRM